MPGWAKPPLGQASSSVPPHGKGPEITSHAPQKSPSSTANGAHEPSERITPVASVPKSSPASNAGFEEVTLSKVPKSDRIVSGDDTSRKTRTLKSESNIHLPFRAENSGDDGELLDESLELHDEGTYRAEGELEPLRGTTGPESGHRRRVKKRDFSVHRPLPKLNISFYYVRSTSKYDYWLNQEKLSEPISFTSKIYTPKKDESTQCPEGQVGCSTVEDSTEVEKSTLSSDSDLRSTRSSVIKSDATSYSGDTTVNTGGQIENQRSERLTTTNVHGREETGKANVSEPPLFSTQDRESASVSRSETETPSPPDGSPSPSALPFSASSRTAYYSSEPAKALDGSDYEVKTDHGKSTTPGQVDKETRVYSSETPSPPDGSPSPSALPFYTGAAYPSEPAKALDGGEYEVKTQTDSGRSTSGHVDYQTRGYVSESYRSTQKNVMDSHSNRSSTQGTELQKFADENATLIVETLSSLYTARNSSEEEVYVTNKHSVLHTSENLESVTSQKSQVSAGSSGPTSTSKSPEHRYKYITNSKQDTGFVNPTKIVETSSGGEKIDDKDIIDWFLKETNNIHKTDTTTASKEQKKAVSEFDSDIVSKSDNEGVAEATLSDAIVSSNKDEHNHKFQNPFGRDAREAASMLGFVLRSAQEDYPSTPNEFLENEAKQTTSSLADRQRYSVTEKLGTTSPKTSHESGGSDAPTSDAITSTSESGPIDWKSTSSVQDSMMAVSENISPQSEISNLSVSDATNSGDTSFEVKGSTDGKNSSPVPEVKTFGDTTTDSMISGLHSTDSASHIWSIHGSPEDPSSRNTIVVPATTNGENNSSMMMASEMTPEEIPSESETLSPRTDGVINASTVLDPMTSEASHFSSTDGKDSPSSSQNVLIALENDRIQNKSSGMSMTYGENSSLVIDVMTSDETEPQSPPSPLSSSERQSHSMSSAEKGVATSPSSSEDFSSSEIKGSSRPVTDGDKASPTTPDGVLSKTSTSDLPKDGGENTTSPIPGAKIPEEVSKSDSKGSSQPTVNGENLSSMIPDAVQSKSSSVSSPHEADGENTSPISGSLISEDVSKSEKEGSGQPTTDDGGDDSSSRSDGDPFEKSSESNLPNGENTSVKSGVSKPESSSSSLPIVDDVVSNASPKNYSDERNVLSLLEDASPDNKSSSIPVANGEKVSSTETEHNSTGNVRRSPL